jgi:hypothetical protein
MTGVYLKWLVDEQGDRVSEDDARLVFRETETQEALALMKWRYVGEPGRLEVMVQLLRAFNYPVLSAQGSLAEQDCEMYCKFCGKGLAIRPKGEMIFRGLTGACDCSWKCCVRAQAGTHNEHLAYRPFELVRAKFVIASTKVPAKGHLEIFVSRVKNAVNSLGAFLIAMRGEEGPGCYNYGLIIAARDEEQADKAAREITMVLQPARYANCTDPDWTGFDSWKGL